MGRVYRAIDPDLGRDVAIKLLIEPDADPQLTRRFLREARLTAGLSHPNLVPVYEVGTVTRAGEPHHFIVMELITGGTLADELGQAPRERLIDMLAQVCRAVCSAHEAGVVHRDLKPANVLIHPDGRPMVTDFGLARGGTDSTAITGTDQLLGTPAYMAPEQVAAAGDRIGPATDVWALGVMLYEILAGRRPFQAQTQAALFAQILSREPQPPAAPPELLAICRVALAKQPGDRYADAGLLGEDLQRWIDGEPIRAQPPSSLRLIGRRVSRHRWLLLSWLLAAAALAGLAVWQGGRTRTGPTPSRSRDADAQADRQARLLAALAPHRRRVQRFQTLYYVKGADLASQRTEIESSLGEVEKLAAEADPLELPDAWLLAARGWLVSGRVDRARAALEKAARHAPDDPRVALYRGKLCAHEIFGSLLRYHFRPRQSWRWTDFQQTVGAQKDRLEAAIRASPKGMEREQLEIVALFYTEEAEEAARRSLIGSRRYADRHGVELFDLLLALRMPAGRHAPYLDRVLARCPQHTWALLFRAAMSSDPARRATDAATACRINPYLSQAWMLRGIAAIELGRHAQAIAHLTRAIELGDQNALLNRSQLYVRLGRFEPARVDLERALRALPHDPWVLMCLANVQDKLGQPQRALATYGRALARRPDMPETLARMALLLNRQGQPERALRLVDRALRKGPEDLYARQVRAILLHGLKRPREALVELDRNLSRSPDYKLSLVLRADIRKAQGDLRGAARDHDHHVRIAPRDPLAHLLRGQFLRRTGKPREGLADYHRALALEPNWGRAWRGKGMCHQLLNQLPQAVQAYDRAIELEPKGVAAYTNRGRILWAQGKHRAGLKDLQQATRLAPHRWDTWYDEGNALARLKRYTEAAKALREALRRAPASRRGRITALLRAVEKRAKR